MNKERFKGVVLGFILFTLLSTSVVVFANTQTVTREITYGIRVNLNGQIMPFDYDSRPFVMDGRTFLPVRAIADALGLEVGFDPATNTAYLVSSVPMAVAPQPTPIPTPAPDQVPSPPTAHVEAVTRVFTGSGDEVIPLEPFSGQYVFFISGNSDARHFSVHAHGSRRTLLVNTTSPYEGITLNREWDTNTLEISATGEWRIEQRPLSDMRSVSKGETISGSGDEIVRVASHGSTATVTGNTAGRHFSVHAHGARRSLLVNTTSEYSGRVMLRNSYTMLEISATGAWTITLE